ncbi:hypothetical protein HPB50_017439 [Hyalomma asiaticum]|uniref:Uncharacterized protein n=1 Tax=Hyalomma asiaticum TaxID=266040 RepID=A0ACB7RV77_HYAAI|nr:hypothetical protein HPB50_017439 [Hyalomma asiaticum]
MASPSKSNLQMVPSNAPSQQEPRRGASQMPFVMLQTTESPSHQPYPHSAANQQSTFTLATAQPLLEPTHQALPARSPPTSAVPMASWLGRQQSPLLVPGRAPTATHTRIMVPPSTGRVNNPQSQDPHSVTWPPDQHALRNLTAAEVLEQMIVQQLTAPANVGGNLGTLHHIPSTPPLMQRSMDSLEVPGNSQLERALLPPPSPEPQLSPTGQPVGGAPFCSTPQKQYTNSRSVPDSSSCPASPLKPSLNAHDQRLQQFPQHTPTGLCRQRYRRPVNQCSSIFPPEGDVAQPMSLPEEGSSRADGSGKERVKSAHTAGAQFGPPASLPTEATSRHIPSDKRVTEGTTVEHLKERKINVPASLPHISWHGKMEEAERPEHYSSHCVQHQASPKKPSKSDKSILDPQVDPNSSNASSSPLEGYTLSRRGETAPKSYVRAASEATRKFWLETNENVQASTVTLQGAREKSYYPRKSPQKIASNVRLNEIPQVQESKPNVSRILFDVSTPDRETDIAPVKRSRPTSEPTGDVDLCTLSNRQGVPESDVTGDEQRFMTAEGDETTGLGPYSAGAMILTQAEKSSSEAAQQEWLPAEAGLHSHGMNISGSATCDQRVQEHKGSTERYVKSYGEYMYSTRKLPADAQRGAEGGQNVQAPYRGDAEISSVVAPEHPVVSASVENSAVPQRTERRQTESDTSVSADSSTSQATDEPTADAECEVSTMLTTELRTGTRRRERKQRKPMFRGHYQQ